MLSFLYRLMDDYRKGHGLAPNLVYLSAPHYQQLVDELPEFKTHEELTAFLQMEIVISADAAHPHVAWIRPRHYRLAVGC
jgi:hypothetical protein